MKIRKILLYLEVIILVGIIIGPVLFFSIALGIGMGPAKVDLREGDVIQLTITNFSFDYNLTDFVNYTVTPGIYLNPILYFEEGEEYDIRDEGFVYNSYILFEGNETSGLQFNFHVDSINKKKSVANLTLDYNNKTFSIGLFGRYSGVRPPFFEPTLSIGLTFRSEIEENKSYVHWRFYFVFSTTNTRYALNYHSREMMSSYGWAKEETNIFSSAWPDWESLAYATYRLKRGENRLQEVSARYLGRAYLNDPSLPLSSNVSIYTGIPTNSYWNYYFAYKLKYFRGGIEI